MGLESQRPLPLPSPPPRQGVPKALPTSAPLTSLAPFLAGPWPLSLGRGVGWGLGGCSEPKVPHLGEERQWVPGVTLCLGKERDGKGVSKMGGGREGSGVIRAGCFLKEGVKGRTVTSDPPRSLSVPAQATFCGSQQCGSVGETPLLLTPSCGKEGSPELATPGCSPGLSPCRRHPHPTPSLTELILGGLGAAWIPRARSRVWVQGLGAEAKLTPRLLGAVAQGGRATGPSLNVPAYPMGP